MADNPWKAAEDAVSSLTQTRKFLDGKTQEVKELGYVGPEEDTDGKVCLVLAKLNGLAIILDKVDNKHVVVELRPRLSLMFRPGTSAFGLADACLAAAVVADGTKGITTLLITTFRATFLSATHKLAWLRKIQDYRRAMGEGPEIVAIKLASMALAHGGGERAVLADEEMVLHFKGALGKAFAAVLVGKLLLKDAWERAGEFYTTSGLKDEEAGKSVGSVNAMSVGAQDQKGGYQPRPRGERGQAACTSQCRRP